jgi:hypothetical protein
MVPTLSLEALLEVPARQPERPMHRLTYNTRVILKHPPHVLQLARSQQLLVGTPHILLLSKQLLVGAPHTNSGAA